MSTRDRAPDVNGYPLRAVNGRFWRMLRVGYQRDPLSGEGARLKGGRWNRSGVPALYLAADHATAISEFYQRLIIPGTLVAYDIRSDRIAILADETGAAVNDLVAEAAASEWTRIARLDRREPPSWTLADRLIADGADGALVPSAQDAGGTNLVLWRWSAEVGDGATVRVIDPAGDLSRPAQSR